MACALIFICMGAHMGIYSIFLGFVVSCVHVRRISVFHLYLPCLSFSVLYRPDYDLDYDCILRGLVCLVIHLFFFDVRSCYLPHNCGIF